MIHSLQTKILKRFMNEKDLKAFMQSYEEAKYIRSVIKKPNQSDLRISHYFSTAKSIGETAEKFGTSRGRVMNALARTMAYSK